MDPGRNVAESSTEATVLNTESVLIMTMIEQKANSVAFSPQSNYIDQATAASHRNECQSLWLECCVFNATDLHGRQSLFSNTKQLLSSCKYFLDYPQKAEWVDSVPDLLLRKSSSGGNRTRNEK
jgi:hypothetical protein